MRAKMSVLLLILVFAMAPAVMAQGGGAITLDEWVEGTLTESDYEHVYTFEGTAGQFVMVEMNTINESWDLDPALVLRDPTGLVIASNDDFISLDSMIAISLPSDGEYTVLATRSGGATGSGGGDYQVRVSNVELLAPGVTVEATIYANYDKDVPTTYFLRPEVDGTWVVTFGQPEGELRASLSMVTLSDSYSVFDLQDTSGVRSCTLNVDVVAGEVYTLTVQQSYWSYVYEDISIPVTVSINTVE